MIWVIKVGSEDPCDVPEYLHAWDTNSAGQIVNEKWVGRQRHAHRFADRNAAARTAESSPINAYSDTVRVVRLVTKRPSHASSPRQEKG